MKYTIEKGGSPAYLQLYRQIRDDIINGVYPFGSKLPSKRLVADEVGVSIITVEHAYALLGDEGYIEAKQRSGYYVIFRRADGFATAPGGISHLPHIEFHRENTHKDFSYSLLSKTMRRVINEYGEAILESSPHSGCSELTCAISKYMLRSRGIAVKPEQIIIGSGSEHLYGLIVELLGRDRIFAIEAPSYKKIEQVYKACDVKLQMLPLGSDGIDSVALWKTNADVLHISPYRSFPSGVSATASKRHEYLRWAENANRYIIEDDFESEFSVSKKAEQPLFSHTKNDNVIYMNTFSKTISPSLRVGYMILPEHLVYLFKEKLGFYSCTVPTFEQLVLAELIESGEFERHINRVRRKIRKELIKQ